jgi:hypothetical protein
VSFCSMQVTFRSCSLLSFRASSSIINLGQSLSRIGQGCGHILQHQLYNSHNNIHLSHAIV